MKMSFLERLLLALTGLLGVLFAAALGVMAYYGDALGLTLGDMRISLRGGVWPSLLAGVIALIVLIWGLKLLSMAFKREPRNDRQSVSVQHTENGSVRISVAAMDTLVKQAIAHDEGVVDIKTAIINHEDSISVSIDMTLASDVHIPNVTMMMQRTIKNFIEEFSGIAVREVTIMVSKIIEVTPQPPLNLTKPESAKAISESKLPKLERMSAPEEEPVEETVESELEPQQEPEPESGTVVPAEAAEPAEMAEAEPSEAPAAETDEIVNEKDVW